MFTNVIDSYSMETLICCQKFVNKANKCKQLRHVKNTNDNYTLLICFDASKNSQNLVHRKDFAFRNATFYRPPHYYMKR